MPTMYEIYKMHSVEYDRLVNAEDYRGNLHRALHELVDWNGANVIEAGIGTGRVTELYVRNAKRIECFDRELHMLEAAKRRLVGSLDKIRFHVGDNLDLPQLGMAAAVFVEGWSWGHSIGDTTGLIDETTNALMNSAVRNLGPGGSTVLIETMGTNVEEANPPDEKLAEFYRLLVAKHGMVQKIIRTDYQFRSVQEAVTVTGFFFGESMMEAVTARNSTVVPEWTGIWKGTL